MLTRSLLYTGALSSLWYVCINIFVPLAWPAYSVVNQTVSELSAVGAPTRALWVAVAIPYTLLFAAFGWGVLRSASDNRALGILGWLILFYSAFNLYWPPMHMRDVLAAGGGTLTDTLHLTWAGVTVLLFVMMMGFGAFAFGSRFRAFTFASLIMLVIFGILTSLTAPHVGTNQPTPWIGIYERINIGVFLFWILILSALLLGKYGRRAAS